MTKQSAKDKEMLVMCEYLSERPPYSGDIFKQSSGVFRTERFIADVEAPDRERRDYRSFTIDFNEQKINVYAYDESGHNGDHYNCVQFSIDWDHLLTAYEPLRNATRSLAAAEAKQMAADRFADDCLKQVLDAAK